MLCGAGIEQPGDVGVAQAGRRLALLRETLQHGDAVHAALQ